MVPSPITSESYNGQYFQKISIPNHGRLPCFNLPLLSEIPKCITPPCPQNSIIVNLPSPSEFLSFLEVHFRLSNASIKKRTWIYASSRLWFSSARRQALLFSNKKNLLLWPGCANSFLTLNLAIKRNTTYGSVTPLCVLVLFWCFQSKIAQIQTVKIFWWANTVEFSISPCYVRLHVM